MTETRILPVLPLRDIVVFPGMVVPLFVGRDKSVAALEAAMASPGDKDIFLLAQLDQQLAPVERGLDALVVREGEDFLKRGLRLTHAARAVRAVDRARTGDEDRHPGRERSEQRAAVDRVVEAAPGLGEPGQVHAARVTDVGVAVEERETRRDRAHGDGTDGGNGDRLAA